MTDKEIAKEILLKMMDDKIGEFAHSSSLAEFSAITTDMVGKAYQNILGYVSSQE